MARDVVTAVVSGLKAKQKLFELTGGTHAAAAFDLEGRLLALHEDVGRHNAVDKVVGALLYDGRVGARLQSDAAAPVLLAVSGRASFEVLQKAAVARIPIVASVSAPSSLAIDLALKSGITLAGFVRGPQFNVYAHPERIAG